MKELIEGAAAILGKCLAWHEPALAVKQSQKLECRLPGQIVYACIEHFSRQAGASYGVGLEYPALGAAQRQAAASTRSRTRIRAHAGGGRLQSSG